MDSHCFEQDKRLKCYYCMTIRIFKLTNTKANHTNSIQHHITEKFQDEACHHTVQ